MKVQTHLKAGTSAAEIMDQAEEALSKAAQDVAHAAQGLGHSASDLTYHLGIGDTLARLWYWPFNPPHA